MECTTSDQKDDLMISIAFYNASTFYFTLIAEGCIL